MGLFELLRRQNQINSSILPNGARQLLMSGKLPQLNTDRVFLKTGETCVYIDKAIYNEHVTKKVYQHYGHSSPGLFKGHRLNTGRGTSKEYTDIRQVRGILYITNKRLLFQGDGKVFEKAHSRIGSIDTYTNAVIIQYGDKLYELIVPDGNLVSRTLRLVV